MSDSGFLSGVIGSALSGPEPLVSRRLTPNISPHLSCRSLVLSFVSYVASLCRARSSTFAVATELST